jgi:hypothetical protein
LGGGWGRRQGQGEEAGGRVLRRMRREGGRRQGEWQAVGAGVCGVGKVI